VIEEVLSLVVPTPEMIMNNIQLKLSIGATIVPFGEESDFNLLVAEADTAMYSAKLASGARCVFYEPWMKEGIGLTKLG
jgi:GGDEF domain-containing protein